MLIALEALECVDRGRAPVAIRLGLEIALGCQRLLDLFISFLRGLLRSVMADGDGDRTFPFCRSAFCSSGRVLRRRGCRSGGALGSRDFGGGFGRCLFLRRRCLRRNSGGPCANGARSRKDRKRRDLDGYKLPQDPSLHEPYGSDTASDVANKKKSQERFPSSWPLACGLTRFIQEACPAATTFASWAWQRPHRAARRPVNGPRGRPPHRPV